MSFHFTKGFQYGGHSSSDPKHWVRRTVHRGPGEPPRRDSSEVSSLTFFGETRGGGGEEGVVLPRGRTCSRNGRSRLQWKRLRDTPSFARIQGKSPLLRLHSGGRAIPLPSGPEPGSDTAVTLGPGETHDVYLRTHVYTGTPLPHSPFFRFFGCTHRPPSRTVPLDEQ